MKRSHGQQGGEQAPKRQRLVKEEEEEAAAKVVKPSEVRYETAIKVLRELALFPSVLAKLTLEYDRCHGAADCLARREYCQPWLSELLTDMRSLTVVWAGHVAHRIKHWELVGKVSTPDSTLDSRSLMIEPTSDQSSLIRGAQVQWRRVFYGLSTGGTLDAGEAAHNFCAFVDSWYNAGHVVQIYLSFVAAPLSDYRNTPLKKGERRDDLKFEAYTYNPWFKPPPAGVDVKPWPELGTRYDMSDWFLDIKGQTLLAEIVKVVVSSSSPTYLVI